MRARPSQWGLTIRPVARHRRDSGESKKCVILTAPVGALDPELQANQKGKSRPWRNKPPAAPSLATRLANDFGQRSLKRQTQAAAECLKACVSASDTDTQKKMLPFRPSPSGRMFRPIPRPGRDQRNSPAGRISPRTPRMGSAFSGKTTHGSHEKSRVGRAGRSRNSGRCRETRAGVQVPDPESGGAKQRLSPHVRDAE